jgi:hypothetical protein
VRMAYSTRRHPRNVDRQWLPWSAQAAPKDTKKRRCRQSPAIEMGCPHQVRLPSISGRIADIPDR